MWGWSELVFGLGFLEYKVLWATESSLDTYILFAALLVTSEVTETKGVYSACLAILYLSFLRSVGIALSCSEHITKILEKQGKQKQNCAKQQLLCLYLLGLLLFPNSSKKNKLVFSLTSLMWVAAMTNHLDFPLHPAPAYKPVNTYVFLLIHKSTKPFT